MTRVPWRRSPDRCFGADPTRRAVARELYATVNDLLVVAPYGQCRPGCWQMTTRPKWRACATDLARRADQVPAA